MGEKIRSIRSGGKPLLRSAAGFLGLILSPLASFDSLWEFGVDRSKGGAGLLLLAELLQRHAELQEAVRRLAVLRIGLVTGQERLCGGSVVGLHIKSFPEPELGVAGELMLRVFFDEASEPGLRLAIAPAQQALIGKLVKLLWRFRHGRGGFERGRLDLFRNDRLPKIGLFAGRRRASHRIVG